MVLPEHHVEMHSPVPVVVDELRVLVAVGRAGQVFHPQQLQRHALTAQLAVDQRPVRQGSSARGRERRPAVEQPLQRAVIHSLRQRPGQPRRRRPRQAVHDGGSRHTGRHRHLVPAPPVPKAQPKDLSYLAHGDSGSGHGRAPRTSAATVRGGCPALLTSRRRSDYHSPVGVAFSRNRVSLATAKGPSCCHTDGTTSAPTGPVGWT